MFSASESDTAAKMLDGEREVIGAYNHAMMHGGPDDLMQLLQHQAEELQALIARHDPRQRTAGAHP